MVRRQHAPATQCGAPPTRSQPRNHRCSHQHPATHTRSPFCCSSSLPSTYTLGSSPYTLLFSREVSEPPRVVGAPPRVLPAGQQTAQPGDSARRQGGVGGAASGGRAAQGAARTARRLGLTGARAGGSTSALTQRERCQQLEEAATWQHDKNRSCCAHSICSQPRQPSW